MMVMSLKGRIKKHSLGRRLKSNTSRKNMKKGHLQVCLETEISDVFALKKLISEETTFRVGDQNIEIIGLKLLV